MLLELKNNMKISLIKEVHKYSIKHLEKCDRWNTYVKTATGRKEIKAKTEQECFMKSFGSGTVSPGLRSTHFFRVVQLQA